MRAGLRVPVHISCGKLLRLRRCAGSLRVSLFAGSGHGIAFRLKQRDPPAPVESRILIGDIVTLRSKTWLPVLASLLQLLATTSARAEPYVVDGLKLGERI